jgi:hypothetical protein
VLSSGSTSDRAELFGVDIRAVSYHLKEFTPRAS